MLRGSILIYMLFMLVACTNTQPAQHLYWNSKAYFETDTNRLKQEKTRLHKELNFGSENEQIQIDTPNWTKELDPFISIDLSKPGYSGRFAVDTLILNDSEYTVAYKAKDTQTDLRFCSTTLQQGKIIAVRAEFSSANTLYKSDKLYTYTPDSGYTISGYQSVTLGNPVHYTIKGIFVTP